MKLENRTSVAEGSEQMLTPKEAADFLKVSDSFLAKRRMTGDGPVYIKVGRAVRYTKGALLEWLKAQRCSSTREKLDRQNISV
jgi:hypothetical protein